MLKFWSSIMEALCTCQAWVDLATIGHHHKPQPLVTNQLLKELSCQEDMLSLNCTWSKMAIIAVKLWPGDIFPLAAAHCIWGNHWSCPVETAEHSEGQDTVDEYLWNAEEGLACGWEQYQMCSLANYHHLEEWQQSCWWHQEDCSRSSNRLHQIAKLSCTASWSGSIFLVSSWACLYIWTAGWQQ